MDIFKRNLAPISDEAWDEIDSQAKEILKSTLTARKFTDLDGPKGADFGAVSLGRIKLPKGNKKDELAFGVHQVLPLVEVRIPFQLDVWELDNISRGAKDPDLEPLEKAAAEIARFEDRAIYFGLKEAQISGLKESSANKMMKCPQNLKEAACNIPQAIRLLKENAIEGPYTLITSAAQWEDIIGYEHGYPLRKQLKEIMDGEIVLCPHIEGMFLVSNRGGDFSLTLGMDLSIGYESHDSKNVKLYLTESFTFQVLEPKAVVVFE